MTFEDINRQFEVSAAGHRMIRYDGDANGHPSQVGLAMVATVGSDTFTSGVLWMNKATFTHGSPIFEWMVKGLRTRLDAIIEKNKVQQ
jgi:hypothetical protein